MGTRLRPVPEVQPRVHRYGCRPRGRPLKSVSCAARIATRRRPRLRRRRPVTSSSTVTAALLRRNTRPGHPQQRRRRPTRGRRHRDPRIALVANIHRKAFAAPSNRRAWCVDPGGFASEVTDRTIPHNGPGSAPDPVRNRENSSPSPLLPHSGEGERRGDQQDGGSDCLIPFRRWPRRSRYRHTPGSRVIPRLAGAFGGGGVEVRSVSRRRPGRCRGAFAKTCWRTTAATASFREAVREIEEVVPVNVSTWVLPSGVMVGR